MKIKNLTGLSLVGHDVSIRSEGNMGLNVQMSEQETIENRQHLAIKNHLNLDHFVAMQQIHSTYIHSVRESDLGRGSRLWSTAIPSCDGLVTDQKGPVLMAFGADCPLIIAADEERGVIGIAHSGWKGTIKGIAKELIFKMTKDFDGDVRHINVGITASARECCYEVDHDLAERFRAEGYSDSVHCRDSSSYINLHDTIRSQLLGEGVCDDKINSMTDCTICGNQFFSFRKEKEQSGRFCGLIWLKQ